MTVDAFYSDGLRFGSLRGFKHFSVSLRGREELIVTVPSCDVRRLAACLASGSRRARALRALFSCARSRLSACSQLHGVGAWLAGGTNCARDAWRGCRLLSACGVQPLQRLAVRVGAWRLACAVLCALLTQHRACQLRSAPVALPQAERDLPLSLESTRHWRERGAGAAS
jgi:hypothetical protein